MQWLDTLMMSLGSIRANKLRSFLTLVGIVAGVASIIGVMTGISVVQSTLEEEMSVLGAQTFQVQKWPAGGFASDARRRAAMRRPPLTLDEAALIQQRVESVDIVGSELWDFGFVVEYKGGHLYEAEKVKRQIGEVWAAAMEGKGLFCMPTDRRFDDIDRAVAGG